MNAGFLGLPTSRILLKTGKWKISAPNPLKHVHVLITQNLQQEQIKQHHNMTPPAFTDVQPKPAPFYFRDADLKVCAAQRWTPLTVSL